MEPFKILFLIPMDLAQSECLDARVQQDNRLFHFKLGNHFLLHMSKKTKNNMKSTMSKSQNISMRSATFLAPRYWSWCHIARVVWKLELKLKTSKIMHELVDGRNPVILSHYLQCFIAVPICTNSYTNSCQSWWKISRSWKDSPHF